MLAATLHNQPVHCEPAETAQFNAPPGQTCGSYAGAFANASTGALLNPDASEGCMFCPYSSGDDYLATLNINAGDKWRDFGIFLAFCVSNWALVYFFVWSVRVKGWRFGFGAVFGGLGKMGKMLVKGGKKGKEAEGEEKAEK